MYCILIAIIIITIIFGLNYNCDDDLSVGVCVWGGLGGLGGGRWLCAWLPGGVSVAPVGPDEGWGRWGLRPLPPLKKGVGMGRNKINK